MDKIILWLTIILRLLKWPWHWDIVFILSFYTIGFVVWTTLFSEGLGSLTGSVVRGEPAAWNAMESGEKIVPGKLCNESFFGF